MKDGPITLYRPTAPGPDYDYIGQNRLASGSMRDMGGNLGGRGPMGETDAAMTRRLWEDYQQAQTRWANQAINNYAFSQGIQWRAEDIDKLNEMNQKVAVRNVIHRALDQLVSIMTAKKPQFRATAREDSDLRRAHLRSMLLTWIWDQSEMCGLNQARDIYCYKAMGRGVMGVYVDAHKDMGKGEVLIESFDPLDVYPDPATQSPLWDDAAHIIVRRYMSAAQIKERWPHVNVGQLAYDDEVTTNQRYGFTEHYRDKEQILRIDEVDRQFDRMFNVLERYSRVKRPFFRLIDPRDAHGEELLSQMEMMERVQDVCFVVETMNGVEVVKDEIGVGHFEQIFKDMGGIMLEGATEARVEYHMVAMPPINTPNGPQPQEPEMMPGPPASEYAIPETHTTLTRTFIAELLKTQLLTYVQFEYDRVRVSASVGSQDLYPAYDLPTSHYPIVPIQKAITYTAYPVSDVSLVRDAQERINKSLSLMLSYMANATNVKIIYPEGSIRSRKRWEEELPRPGTAMLPYDRQTIGTSGNDIQIVHPAPLPGDLLQEIHMETAYINDMMGAYPMSQGDPQDAPDTYRGTLQIDEYAGRRILAQLNDVYRAYSRAGQVALDLAADVYEPSKVIQVVAPNGDTEEASLDDWSVEAVGFKKKITNIYDVKIVANSTMPSNRWALVEAYKELYSLGIVDMEAVLRKSDIPDAEQIIERMSENRRLMQMVEEMREVIDRNTKEMATMEGELKHADRQVAVQKFIAELHALSARLTKQVETHEERVKMIEQHARDLAKAKAQAQYKPRK